jgi:hypothetical protein
MNFPTFITRPQFSSKYALHHFCRSRRHHRHHVRLQKACRATNVRKRAEARPFLRVLLVGLSLIGMMSTSLLTDTLLDVGSVSADLKLLALTLISAYGSHWLYVLAGFIRNWKDYLYPLRD